MHQNPARLPVGLVCQRQFHLLSLVPVEKQENHHLASESVSIAETAKLSVLCQSHLLVAIDEEGSAYRALNRSRIHMLLRNRNADGGGHLTRCLELLVLMVSSVKASRLQIVHCDASPLHCFRCPSLAAWLVILAGVVLNSRARVA